MRTDETCRAGDEPFLWRRCQSCQGLFVCGHDRKLRFNPKVGMARRAVPASKRRGTSVEKVESVSPFVPPARTRAGTAQRAVPTCVRPWVQLSATITWQRNHRVRPDANLFPPQATQIHV